VCGFTILLSKKNFLEVVPLEAWVQIPVHSSHMLLLDCPICMMLATIPPLAIFEPILSSPQTYTIQEEQKMTSPHQALFGLM
jgi:tRNA isopentenyl-2-thiomethyl-A-37 hydroxylase MiaE